VEVWANEFTYNHATFYWSACTVSIKWAVMYLCARSIDLAYFYDFSIGFFNCSDSDIFYWSFHYYDFSIRLWNCFDYVVLYVFHFLTVSMVIQINIITFDREAMSSTKTTKPYNITTVWLKVVLNTNNQPWQCWRWWRATWRKSVGMTTIETSYHYI
jgi:hypothetical protein